eukprot:CAMPEP_0179419868 /NCGR_PEP_ID=MMETSP0799-20121207/8845_1 /TAXON_ID=46947 /ORGANISM="Geminigera cryophila, Strain CCMP2564" /LENGTH=151 /DNA_ID=CAMNT_0021193403 /DNA_START=40 /DNA_END=495 /DNA_ORIENTATION=-
MPALVSGEMKENFLGVEARLEMQLHSSARTSTAKQITLGLTFGKKKAGDVLGLAVVRIKDGGIAAVDARLALGDSVVSVDGAELLGLGALAINRLLVGDEGSVACLKVIKKGDTLPQEISLMRLLGSVPPARTGARTARLAGFGVINKMTS